MTCEQHDFNNAGECKKCGNHRDGGPSCESGSP